MSRYTICAEGKTGTADTLDQALSTLGGMMHIDKQQATKELAEKGESAQVYGFCTGS